MQEGYLRINGVQTKVVTYGKWVEESFRDDEPKDLILCIPGNPGITEMYKPFLETIHREVGYPVWIVGHAGHERPMDWKVHMPHLIGNEDLFGLRGQIEHKAAFIKKYVPKDARIHFIGHSVGSYTIMNLLKIPEIKSRVVKNYFLFPTIERLKYSTNGIFMTRIIQPCVPIIIFLAWIFTLLPFMIQTILIYVYCKVERIEKHQMKPIIAFVDPYILRNIFFMAYQQIYLVVERDNDVLIENKSNIKLYYGVRDNWVPEDCYDKLKRDIPGIDAERCRNGFAHIFVHRDSIKLGMLVAIWLKKQ